MKPINVPHAPAMSMNGFFDSILDIVETGTNLYNSAAPILDPIRDGLVKQIVGGSNNPVPQQPPIQYSNGQPQYQTQTSQVRNQTSIQTPPPIEKKSDMVMPILLGVGATLIVGGLVALAVSDDPVEKRKK